MIRPKVSVVLPVWNAECTIAEALASVCGQTFTDFEVIAIDDGSTDGTRAILEHTAERDRRLSVVGQQHRGLAPTLNAGIARARGEYIARQDADDVSMPERFERQVRFLDTYPRVCALGTAGVVVDIDGRVVRSFPIRHGASAVREGLRTFRVTPIHGSMMLRRQSILAAGGYRDAFAAAQDADLWLRLSERHDIDNLDEPLYRWRLAPGSVYAERRALQVRYAAIARLFAVERERYGGDSYADLERCAGDLDRFADGYRLRARLRALWGELLLRAGCRARLAFREFHAAVASGDLRPRTLAGWVWTGAGLRWPGGAPLVATPSLERGRNSVL